MKSQKNKYITQTTITSSIKQINSNRTIYGSLQQKGKKQGIININGRYTSMLNSQYEQQISEIHENYLEIQSAKKRINIMDEIDQKYMIFQSLQKIFFKKKRYCFQLLKQFILFPDDNSSSIMSLSSYNPLIFQDQVIHTLVKIIETKTIQNKIWGFLNLKMRPYIQAAIIIEEKVTDIHKRKIKQIKKQTFDIIKKTVAVEIQLAIHQRKLQHVSISFPDINISSIQKSFVKENKQIKKNNLTSNTISANIMPTIVIKQTNSNSKENYDYQPKVLKSNYNYNSPSTTKVYSSIEEYYRQNQINVPVKTYQPIRQYVKSPSKIQTKYQFLYPPRKNSPTTNITVKSQQTKKQQIKKYNIIHYYQRPKQLDRFNSGQMRYQSKCYICSLHCCQCQVIKNQSYLCSQCKYRSCINEQINREKQSFINTTSYSHQIPHNLSKITMENSQLTKLKQLSDIQSRIQYLNFLKKIVKQQAKI